MKTKQEPRGARNLTEMLLVLILLAAFFLRTHDLARFPPGPFYDEAAAAILAGDVASGDYLPLFIRAYTGHEVLYYYLAAPIMQILGPTYYALRVASALMGLFSVLMAYVLARELFAGGWLTPAQPSGRGLDASRWLGLFAAAFMATSFWHVSVSRYGFRAISLPLLQALMLLALWRGLRRNRWRWIVAAGVFCGLTAYTYLSSRIIPLALALVWGMVLVAERRRWRLRLAQLGVFALAALVVFAPLGLFFLANPDTFGVRMQQVSFLSGGDPAQALLRSSLRALEVFTLRGDPQLRFNIRDMPMFQGWLAGLFYAGLLMAVVQAGRGGGFLGRVRYGLILVWILVLLLPSILADPWEVPHSLRSMGIMPMVFFIPALGAVAMLALIQYLLARFAWSARGEAVQRPSAGLEPASAYQSHSPVVMHRAGLLATTLATGLLLISLAGSLLQTYQAYFLRWGPDPNLYYDNYGDIADMARYLDRLPDEASGRTLYVSDPNYRSPTVAVLAHNYDQMKWLHGNLVFVFSPGPALYAWPHASLPDDFWLARFFPPESRRVYQPGPGDAPAYIVHTLDRAPLISPTYPLNANFGGMVEALGLEPLRDRPSGGRTDAILYWRVLTVPERGDYSQFMTLNDAWGMPRGQGSSFAYPSEQWSPGEIIAERVRIQTEDVAPPGRYTLEVGWWSASTGQRLPVLEAHGRFAGDTVSLGPITVTRRTRPLDLNTLEVSHRLNADLGSLNLVGFDQWPNRLRPGEVEFVTLYWQAHEAAETRPDHTIRLQMRAVDGSQDGQPFILWQGAPVHDTYPTSQWEAGELVADRMGLDIPPGTPPGDYMLEVQVDALPPTALKSFEVQGVSRVWTPPAVAQPLSVTFGASIALTGYTLAVDDARPGQPITLTLVWQSLAPVEENYNVFVHVLDAGGRLQAQKDNMPVEGGYPTALWQPGEFVSDRYVIELPSDLPPGQYALQTGLYVLDSGQRLPVAGGGDSVGVGIVNVVP